MKKALKVILWILLAIVIIVGCYVAYVFLDYHRIDDNLALDVNGTAAKTSAAVGTDYTIVSYNIGFGAYSADYSFFMDGGKYSRAFSKDAVNTNIAGAVSTVEAQKPDFVYFQEVDENATRSYHVDERVPVTSAFPTFCYVYARNYDSPYLFYPITCPHGKSQAGIVTLSSVGIESSVRRSLPIETGFTKFMDLDRCYTVSRVPVENGKTLCLYNLHLSAYTSDGTIATEQLKVLFEDMSAEYAAGNYVIAGGDFNKDLLGDSSAIFGVSGAEYTWAQSFPFDLVPDGFTLEAPFNAADPVPSCRNANAPYDPATAFVLTIDGFIVSDNVTAKSADVISTGFAYSDHNPVKMVFSLNG